MISLSINNERVDLNKIDAEMRTYFNQPQDPDRYLNGWVESISSRVAFKDRNLEDILQIFIQLRDQTKEPCYRGLVYIIQYLLGNGYELSSGYSPSI